MHARFIAAFVALAFSFGLLAPAGAITGHPTRTNVGVPAGTVLTTYAGPTTITSCGVVIDSKTVNGDLTIRAGNGTHSASTPCVTIRKTRVNGVIDDSYTSRGFGPVVIDDSTVANPSTRDVACVSDANYYMHRDYVTGCRSGAQSDGYTQIYDSYLEANRESGSAHMDAFITNGNYGAPIHLQNNTFLCNPTLGDPVPNGAGCAADVGLFGDFSAVTNLNLWDNLFKTTSAAYYCLHGPYESAKPFPNGGNDLIVGNDFERQGTGKPCADAGTVYEWNDVAGMWCNNTYLDGTKVLPAHTDNCA
jgi:hypothetical protein